MFLPKQRMLLIRPVRHILRGAVFVPCLDKFSCYVVRFVAPLYNGHALDEPLTGRIHSHIWSVWQPYFVPLLMDALAEDVFSDLGSLTTLSELAERGLEPIGHALSGEMDKAADLIRTLERYHHADAERWLRELNVADLCKSLHEREAATAKALGLSDSWQPSPFPVELPAAERLSVAEPLFVPRPWTEKPASLLEDAPDQCGSVRFSIEMLNRKGRVLLVAPLSREQAEERHRDHASYVLTTRLADGLLVVARWNGDGDRNNPERQAGASRDRGVILELYSPSHFLQILARGFPCEPGFMAITSLQVMPHDRSFPTWHCSVSGDERNVSVHDDRGPEKIYVERDLTGDDVAIVTMPMPEFGAFEDLVARVGTWLRRMGYGTIV